MRVCIRISGAIFLTLVMAGCGDQFAAESSLTQASSSGINPLNEAHMGEESSAVESTVGVAASSAIISNGTVQLGVHAEGHLNVPGGTTSSGRSGTTLVGLRYVPTNADSLSPGCACEGWGIADADTGAEGHASVHTGGIQNITRESFTSDADSATSVVRVANTFRVTHAYRPSSRSQYLYEVAITIENISASPVGDLRYTRGADWDIAPNTFSEYVTIAGADASPSVLVANDNGFNVVNPLAFHPPLLFSGDATDSGPADHGVHFDLQIGTLAPGASRTLTMFYGASDNESQALAALAAVGADVYSLAQSNWNGTGDPTSPFGAPTGTHGALTGEPATFILAFAGLSRGQPEIFMDNHKHDSVPPGVTFTGNWWMAGAASEHYGVAGVYANVGGGGDSYRFTPEFSGPGNYRVMVWNNCFSPRANNVPHTIVYDGGSTTIPVDQDCATGSHGEWFELGTFPFAAGSAGYLEISDTGLTSGSYIGADGARFLREDVIVVDNGDPETSAAGDWPEALAATEHYISTSVYTNKVPGSVNTYRFTPNVPSSGNYEVSVWNSCYSPRNTSVPHTVAHGGGSTTMNIDQDCATGSHGEWNVLGTFFFAAGSSGYVEISNAGVPDYDDVGADAIRLIPSP